MAPRIHDLAERDANGGAFVLGAATFFLPCGFTQALQLYVLAKGSFVIGALTMLAFSLGTLPALLSLSAMSSFATGNFQRHFLKFAGAAVVVLGIAISSTAWSLPVSDLRRSIAVAADRHGNQHECMASKQVVGMRIEGLDYMPNRFTVKQGVPVEWRIDASEAEACGRILLAPRLGIRTTSVRSNSTTTDCLHTDRNWRVRL